MPTYSIQAPDGKTYQIDGPADAPQESIQQEVLRQHPNAGHAATYGEKVKDAGDKLQADDKGDGSMFSAKRAAGRVDAAFQATVAPIGRMATRMVGNAVSNATGPSASEATMNPTKAKGEQEAADRRGSKVEDFLNKAFTPKTQVGKDFNDLVAATAEPLTKTINTHVAKITDDPKKQDAIKDLITLASMAAGGKVPAGAKATKAAAKTGIQAVKEQATKAIASPVGEKVALAAGTLKGAAMGGHFGIGGMAIGAYKGYKTAQGAVSDAKLARDSYLSKQASKKAVTALNKVAKDKSLPPEVRAKIKEHADNITSQDIE